MILENRVFVILRRLYCSLRMRLNPLHVLPLSLSMSCVFWWKERLWDVSSFLYSFILLSSSSFAWTLQSALYLCLCYLGYPSCFASCFTSCDPASVVLNTCFLFSWDRMNHHFIHVQYRTSVVYWLKNILLLSSIFLFLFSSASSSLRECVEISMCCCDASSLSFSYK